MRMVVRLNYLSIYSRQRASLTSIADAGLFSHRMVVQLLFGQALFIVLLSGRGGLCSQFVYDVECLMDEKEVERAPSRSNLGCAK
ncbi:hypothetical protein K504DRAFT_44767 [Pleomassaria siparia CBS 279.74]|uniref:Uncharacterized protein n=1 Tax=Pleomassaria siparia CBS 279.74 TaxID=1314801 RepID=A0A6G1K616_9PLEO|nr:hypothetical protein K504DRAFT_44767 [Pleomassaria siparia CBS 279.74]